MPSSKNTPSRSTSRPPRLLLWVAGDDDPKVCTGLRLIRLGRAFRVADPARLRPAPVVLDPYAPTPLSAADRPWASRGGLLAVDCSWNRLSDRGGFHFSGPGRPSGRNARRLPFLFAGNPQHYGRLGELNTAEALAAGLFVLGYEGAARELVRDFRGGPAFFDLNAAALARYASAPSGDEVLGAERDLFGGPARVASPPEPSTVRPRTRPL